MSIMGHIHALLVHCSVVLSSVGYLKGFWEGFVCIIPVHCFFDSGLDHAASRLLCGGLGSTL